MNKEEFKNFLYEKIPITKAMGIDVVELTPEKVSISAKLKPNINHHLTAFGGSISSLMTLCGWAMTYINISDVDDKAHVVIKSSSINYLAPIREDFIAECILSNKKDRNDFFEAYNRHGNGRIKLKVTCSDREKLLAEYEGQYVAFK